MAWHLNDNKSDFKHSRQKPDSTEGAWCRDTEAGKGWIQIRVRILTRKFLRKFLSRTSEKWPLTKLHLCCSSTYTTQRICAPGLLIRMSRRFSHSKQRVEGVCRMIWSRGTSFPPFSLRLVQRSRPSSTLKSLPHQNAPGCSSQSNREWGLDWLAWL